MHSWKQGYMQSLVGPGNALGPWAPPAYLTDLSVLPLRPVLNRNLCINIDNLTKLILKTLNIT